MHFESALSEFDHGIRKSLIGHGLGFSFRHASCEGAPTITMENYHLTKLGDIWRLAHQGSHETLKQFPTKEVAVTGSAEFLAGKTASLKIHREDGTFEEERTYPRSEDPADTPG
jgi:hypothetical protein